ncbi:MAG: AMP-binding protein, partial [Eubacteriales bacterium]|nr:AMP-binding protein [Eubacteriales bacterium]
IGPSLRLAVSGAAALDPEIEKGFDKIGLRVVQGYGLTEASPIVAANNDFENKTGTIGHPIRGVEVAIDMPDENGMGEIITRGKNVMLGYFEDPDATDAVIDKDKWLRTGDLGKIDRKGFITITGRAKSMIVFTNGKKAFPEEYETLLNAIPGVRESFAWGNEAPDGDIQICAKIVPDMENFREKDPIPSEEELGAAFSTAIKVINSSLPQYKIIRYFIMNDDEIIKTTTLKIKRNEERDRILNALGKADLDMRRASGNYLPTA